MSTRIFIPMTLVFCAAILFAIHAIKGIDIKTPYLKEVFQFFVFTGFTLSWSKFSNPYFEAGTLIRLPRLLLRPLKLPFELRNFSISSILRLRLSFSSLILIKVDDYYMLIKNGKSEEENLKTKFQPVGGVYKFTSPTETRRRFGLIDDIMKNSPPDDIRVLIKNPFKLFGVLDWFQTGLGVESSPNREFIEELISPNFLPLELFSNVLFEKIVTKKDRIVWSKYNKIFEFKLFEIYQARFTDQQLDFLRELKKNPPEDLKFIRRDEIEKYAGRETLNGYGIAEQTIKILE